ncbi:MAG: isoprenyl transferase [Candidatus Omnitrophica bacterium]|nr:isoprenyl transferase [Candidatus Omnitrophota bacterium]
MPKERLPRHIAIIMDGNGRWANERHLPRHEGHRQGVERSREIMRACADLGIQFLTLYAFSKENWSRAKDEVSFLMKLLSNYLDVELREIHKTNIRFRMIGRLNDLPVDIQKKIRKGFEQTKENTGLTLLLALSYSSREEIVDAVKTIATEVKRGIISSDEINEKMVSDSLSTSGIPDPDLLIRTSGEFRLSNFLLWQLSYTEICILDKYWPDFTRNDLLQAIEIYGNRDRRFGRANELVAKVETHG